MCVQDVVIKYYKIAMVIGFRIMREKLTINKKGKEIFGSREKFNNWLSTYNYFLNCKPISLIHSKEGLQIIYDELNRIKH